MDWDDYEGDYEYEEDYLKTIKIIVPEDTYNNWLDWKKKCAKLNGYETDSKAFEYAIIEALNLEIEESNGKT